MDALLTSQPARTPARIVITTSVAVATVLGTGVVSSVASATPTTSAAHFEVHRTSLTSAQIAQYSKGQNQRVIVLMRDELPSQLGGGAAGLRARSAAISSTQRSIHSELASLHAPHLTQYHFLNALSASVSSLEAKRLASNPQVWAVVPDSKVSLPKRSLDTSAATSAKPKAAAKVNTTPGLCGTTKKPLVEPEALKLIGAQATHYGITGKGVKIAVFPDGLDPNITDYIRPDGTHAIFDYKDFSGEGPAGVTPGGEAFGDASSIIAQGRKTYDLSKVPNLAVPLPSHCMIKIEGVAPGASVAVMKVFGLAADAFDSQILQGMDYAVNHDHVNILSESFGGNPIPNPGTDPTAVFNQLATRHGITVVASSGDAGITNTIGSPASASSGVISTGATTSFRTHAALSEHGYQLGGYKGWENNNISTFSSGGFTDYGPNSVDVVAPGDGGWANCSPDADTYLDCGNQYGGSSDAPQLLDFGGTSESCPLTAATAALVIEAYRNTHHGASPSPAVVKKIIVSSATDLKMPVEEQGAGLVNTRRAVQLARSFLAKPVANTTTATFVPLNIETTSAPGSVHHATVYVRNTSAKTRTITPAVQKFTAPTTIATKTFEYDPASPSAPTFTYWLDGSAEPYVEQDFTVPAGYQRLNVRFGNPQDQAKAQEVFEVLFDPKGKLAQDSNPQGAPNGFGQGDVANPTPGKWRAIFFSRPGSNKYSGPITYQATVQRRVSVAGSVSPAHLKVKPNTVATFTIKYATPTAPGDASMEVNFGAKIGVLPILTRSYAVPTVSKPAAFTGQLTTGNARMVQPSQELAYQFSVPAGVKDIDVDVHVADAGYTVLGELVAPNRTPVTSSETTFEDVTKEDPTETNGQNVHLTWQSPVAGRWSVVLGTLGGSASGKPASLVTGTIAFNTVDVTSSGVPSSAKTVLTPGGTVMASVTVKNTGTTPEIYFIDPRRNGQSTYSLGFLNSPNGTLPVETIDVPTAVVPPATTSLTMIATGSRPVAMTTSPEFGFPEIASGRGTTAVASLSARYVPASQWTCGVTLVGPFPTAAKPGSYACAAFATTDTIDDTIQSTGGNFWDSFTDPLSINLFNPSQSVVVQPGQSTTLSVAITPSDDDAGSTVSGYLGVQSFDAETFSSDGLKQVPFKYTVAEPADS